MLTFNEILDNITDEYQYTIEKVRESYETKLTLVIRDYLVQIYPDFKGNIYFEVNRDFLSVVVNSRVPMHKWDIQYITAKLHKNLCTLPPDLLQCLDDVTITI